MDKTIINLPTIKAIDLEKCRNDTWGYLSLFIKEYHKTCNNGKTNQFNKSQQSLLAYDYIYHVIEHGGFTQLIYDADLEYIFSKSFFETIKLWGVKKLPK
jgi:hypothetical protein